MKNKIIPELRLTRDGAEYEGTYQEGDRLSVYIPGVGTVKVTHTDPETLAATICELAADAYKYGRETKAQEIAVSLNPSRDRSEIDELFEKRSKRD